MSLSQIPGYSTELIALLNRIVGHPVADDMAALATEKGRLDLARQAGKRELVDQLVFALKRQQEESANGQ